MKKIFPICLGVLLAFTACQSEHPVDEGGDDRSIYLSATLEGGAASRAPYSQTVPSVDKPLHSAVWASTTSKKYPDGTLYGNSEADNFEVAVHSEATFRSGEKQLLRYAIYPHNQQPVYFVGLHPQSAAWTTVAQENNVAQCTFTGKEDVMYAPEVSGTYVSTEDVASRVVTLHYYHLLTWLRLKVIAEDEEVVAAWGKIKRITVKSKNSLTIDLTKAATQSVEGKTVFDETCVAFGATEADFPFYQKDSDTEYATTERLQTLPTIPYGEEATTENIKKYAQDVAYALCAPVIAYYQVDDGSGTDTKVKTNEYVITIDTENRTGVQINVDLKTGDGDGAWFEGSTMGKQFTVLLNFKIGNVIAVQTGLTGIDDWDHEGGLGSADLGGSDN